MFQSLKTSRLEEHIFLKAENVFSVYCVYVGPLTEHCKPPTVKSLIHEEMLKKPVGKFADFKICFF